MPEVVGLLSRRLGSREGPQSVLSAGSERALRAAGSESIGELRWLNPTALPRTLSTRRCHNLNTKKGMIGGGFLMILAAATILILSYEIRQIRLLRGPSLGLLLLATYWIIRGLISRNTRE